jgi:hypothetical protein
MQLMLPTLEPSDQPRSLAAPKPTQVPWDRVDELSRMTALEILARLIAQMLATQAVKGAGGE